MGPPLTAHSNDPNIAGVLGEGPTGVYGNNTLGVGNGMIGYSDKGRGVWGHSNQTGIGVLGESKDAQGVMGKSQTAIGVLGEGLTGVYGNNTLGVGNGVIGYSDRGRGVWGHSNQTGIGVLGESKDGPGVTGNSQSGDGVSGSGRRGVVGISPTFQGVYGWSRDNAGVVGESDSLSGVYAISHHAQNAGLFATNDKGGPAAFFQGNIDVTGVINMLGGDIAEDFDADDGVAISPGSVVCINDSGRVGLSSRAYDTAVVGVVAGARGFHPALRLDRGPTCHARLPVTLMGKVMCLVDASFAPVRAGDLLTSSETLGHAMKVVARERGVGAILGKALQPLESGRGLVPVLAMLR